MPYILVRGNLASYGHKNPWRVLVSGLKAADIEHLNSFASGGYCDESTIVYLQHPCVLLTALEVLGYRVVASSSTSVKQDYNEYMWTMRREFSEPDPTSKPGLIMSDCHNHDNCQACNSSVCQTLDEMEFERGIWYAAQNNDLDRVKKLLQRGISPDARDNAGYTALHYAVRNGHLEVCRFLIDSGASLEAKTNAGQATPLHRAVSACQEHIIKMLIKLGADLTAIDADGKTVLHRAVDTGNILVTDLVAKTQPFLKTIKDNKGKLPLDYAVDSKEMQTLLQ